MLKNLTGGAIINYGATLPNASTSYDGALFYKTLGQDQGLYLFGFMQDANTSVAGDQSAQGWSAIVNPGLYVSKTGDIINGALGIIGGGATNDPYGRLSISMPYDANSYGYLGFTRQGQIGWTMGIDSSNRLFFGSGSGVLSNVQTRYFTFAQDGTIQTNGNTVWHTGNDGVGSGLDAGLLGGSPPAFYTNAGNITTGTLPLAQLPYAPVKQGGPNLITVSWTDPKLSVAVDSTSFGTTWPIDISGTAATATFATSAQNATNAVTASKLASFTVGGRESINFNEYRTTGMYAAAAVPPNAPTPYASLIVASNSDVGLQIAGGYSSDALYFRGWSNSGGTFSDWRSVVHNGNIGAQSVNYATTAGSANAVAWNNVTSRPTNVSQFTNDAGYINLSQVPPSIPSGTRMLFQQTNAPTGWTKDTVHNDKALRVVSGSVGTGGTMDFSAAFINGANVGLTALTIAQLPAHDHGTPLYGRVDSGNNIADAGGGQTYGAKRTGMTGGGEGHTHSLNIPLKYLDVIVATKN